MVCQPSRKDLVKELHMIFNELEQTYFAAAWKRDNEVAGYERKLEDRKHRGRFYKPALERAIKSASKSIIWALRFAHPSLVCRDAGGWVPLQKIYAYLPNEVKKMFFGCIDEMFLYMVALDDEKEGRYHIALQLTEMMGSNLETCTGDDSAFRKRPTNMSHMTIDERIIRLGKTSMRDKGCPLLIGAAQSTGWLSYLVFECFSNEMGIDDLNHVHSLTQYDIGE